MRILAQGCRVIPPGYGEEMIEGGPNPALDFRLGQIRKGMSQILFGDIPMPPIDAKRDPTEHPRAPMRQPNARSLDAPRRGTRSEIDRLILYS